MLQSSNSPFLNTSGGYGQFQSQNTNFQTGGGAASIYATVPASRVTTTTTTTNSFNNGNQGVGFQAIGGYNSQGTNFQALGGVVTPGIVNYNSVASISPIQSTVQAGSYQSVGAYGLPVIGTTQFRTVQSGGGFSGGVMGRALF